LLTNGITLGMKKEGETSFAILAGLKEVPELGVDPEKVDNTTLADTMKHSELGIGDPGDLAYKFKWENGANSSYRTLRAVADTKETVSFEQTFPDGTKFHFDAQCGVKVSGGGVNSAVEFTLTIGLQTDIIVVNPTGE
jgi:hypothetical protein